MKRPRRSPLAVLLARLTLAAFAATLPGPAAWAQAIERVSPVAASAISGSMGASLAAPSIMALSPVSSALTAAPLPASALAAAPAAAPSLTAAPAPALSAAAPAASVSIPAAAAPAAPTATAALKSVDSHSAAMAAPDASAADARALSAHTFDAAAARPALDAVSGSFSAGAPALSRSRLSAASDGPERPAAPSGERSGELRRRANALDKALRDSSKGGQLYTEDQLIAKAVALGQKESLSKHLIKILVSDDRLMPLSGNRYVYSEMPERFAGDFEDGEINRGGKLAQQGMRLMREDSLPSHAQGVTALGDALELLKTRDASAAAETTILFKNAAYELLRDVLRERIGKLGDKAATEPGFQDQRDRAVEMFNALNGMHFGAGLEDPKFDARTAAELEEIVGDLKPAKRHENQEEGRSIARGLQMLHLMLQGEQPGGVAPKDGSALDPKAPETAKKGAPAPAEKKIIFKALDTYTYKALFDYGTDITQKAADGKMRPMIGRKAELRQMVKTLLRVEKNNPLVIGEKGVGKTAIINGLAQMIVRGEIPELTGKNIIKIDLNKVVAGTENRGMFEKRMQEIIDAAKNSNGRVILFIDEIHMIVGAGSASGTQDAAQILKESLSDGSLSLIGATTMDEFRKIEKDGALMRRFNPVKLLPPTKEEAVEIVEGVKSIYEKKHGVSISPDTVKAAVSLASRYVTDRHLPDSALDLMDDASAEVELKASEAKKAGEENPTKAVTAEDIAQEISMRTGIPAGKLNEDKKTALKNLPAEMKGQVIGQDEAVEAVAEAVQAGETGYRDPKAPIASFVFLGPTGVGKTELARALAKIKFGSEKNMLRLDMSEYMEKISVSRLISAPPGYVGHDEGGQLTESIRRNPYQVILLDEIEKAHPDVFDVLLQVLEDGRLTDGQGRTVDFSNTIIIMTSNIGGSVSGGEKDEAKKPNDGWRDGGDGFEYKQDSIGFNAKTLKRPKAGSGSSPERAKHYLDAFKEKYRPEFVNRVGEDRVIVFNEIAEKSKLSLILDLRLKALESQLKDKGLKVSLTDAARETLLTKALSQSQYGARPVKQIVDREINRALKDAELEGRIVDGDEVIVDWDAAAGRYRANAAP